MKLFKQKNFSKLKLIRYDKPYSELKLMFKEIDEEFYNTIYTLLYSLQPQNEDIILQNFESCKTSWGVMDFERSEVYDIIGKLKINIESCINRKGYSYTKIEQYNGIQSKDVNYIGILCYVGDPVYAYPHHIWRYDVNNYYLWPKGIMGDLSEIEITTHELKIDSVRQKIYLKYHEIERNIMMDMFAKKTSDFVNGSFLTSLSNGLSTTELNQKANELSVDFLHKKYNIPLKVIKKIVIEGREKSWS